jgi:hypothetical protein
MGRIVKMYEMVIIHEIEKKKYILAQNDEQQKQQQQTQLQNVKN